MPAVLQHFIKQTKISVLTQLLILDFCVSALYICQIYMGRLNLKSKIPNSVGLFQQNHSQKNCCFLVKGFLYFQDFMTLN